MATRALIDGDDFRITSFVIWVMEICGDDSGVILVQQAVEIRQLELGQLKLRLLRSIAGNFWQECVSF